MGTLTGIITAKCPKCGEGDIFKKQSFIRNMVSPVMYKECNHCNHVYEKESGFFWGAMFVSYALTIAQAVATFIICSFFFNDMFDDRIIWIIGLIIVLLVNVNFKYARILWMYIFTSKQHNL
jgi:uncharacterized protein (DUF983 family)